MPRISGLRSVGVLLGRARLQGLRGGGAQGSEPETITAATGDSRSRKDSGSKKVRAGPSAEHTDADSSTGTSNDSDSGSHNGSGTGERSRHVASDYRQSQSLLDGNIERLQFLRKRTGMDLGVSSGVPCSGYFHLLLFVRFQPARVFFNTRWSAVYSS